MILAVVPDDIGGHEAPSSFVGVGTCVRNDSESASASLSASLVFFKRRSSSCRVI